MRKLIRLFKKQAVKKEWTKEEILSIYKMNVPDDYTETERALILLATKNELMPVEGVASLETDQFCMFNEEAITEAILDKNEKVEVYVLHSHPTKTELIQKTIAKLELTEYTDIILGFPSSGDIFHAKDLNAILMATKLVTCIRYFVIANETIIEYNYGYVEEEATDKIYKIISKLDFNEELNRGLIAGILPTMYAIRGIDIKDPTKLIDEINITLVNELFRKRRL